LLAAVLSAAGAMTAAATVRSNHKS
jgi:hypothetical protein